MNTTYNSNTNTNANPNDYIIYLNSARDGYKLKTRDEVEIMQVTGSTLFKDLTPAPEEVATTSKQEDDNAPYWLLLDQELQAQQEEQEQQTALATPEATKQEEPEEKPAPATEATEDPEEVVFLKGGELNKVIAEYSERNGLDIEYQKKQYYFYATPDGYIVKLDKSKTKRTYI